MSWLGSGLPGGGFPGGVSDKEPAYQCRWHKKLGFNPWVGKIPWRRAWQPTPVFLSGESHGQRSLAGYGSQGCKESDTTEVINTHTHSHTHTLSLSLTHTHTHTPSGWNYLSKEMIMIVKLLSRVQLFATPWTVANPAPPSMGFSRQEYWSGLPFPSPGDLPDPGIEPESPAL